MSPNEITTISSGRVRRQSSVGTMTIRMTTAAAAFGTSVRTRPSNTASNGSTAMSTQSRHTRFGGAGDAAGAFHTERSRPIMPLMLRTGGGSRSRRRPG